MPRECISVISITSYVHSRRFVELIRAANYTALMLDRYALPLFAAPHRIIAKLCLRIGLSANFVTALGCVIGLTAALLIAFECYAIALALILANRFFDGVDGTMARISGPTDRGAFLDIVCDFLFYASVPLGFAFANPATNALPAAALLASFIGTGATFLAFAAVAAKAGRDVNPAYPNKAIHYVGGLTEGTETIIAFCLMCVWPQHFAMIAYVFAAACAITIATRIFVGAQSL
jgi:phosphatidylglycerophosphate synthase